jgi:hypothetical protein
MCLRRGQLVRILRRLDWYSGGGGWYAIVHGVGRGEVGATRGNRVQVRPYMETRPSGWVGLLRLVPYSGVRSGLVGV